jgi:hypothetical protein
VNVVCNIADLEMAFSVGENGKELDEEKSTEETLDVTELKEEVEAYKQVTSKTQGKCLLAFLPLDTHSVVSVLE